MGLHKIPGVGQNNDVVLRRSAHLLSVRTDLVAEIDNLSVDRGESYGLLFGLRKRESVLVVAYSFPLGYGRQTFGSVLSRPRRLRRMLRSWWDNLGIEELWFGYRFSLSQVRFLVLGFDGMKRILSWEVMARHDTRIALHLDLADDSLFINVRRGLSLPVVGLLPRGKEFWRSALNCHGRTWKMSGRL